MELSGVLVTFRFFNRSLVTWGSSLCEKSIELSLCGLCTSLNVMLEQTIKKKENCVLEKMW